MPILNVKLSGTPSASTTQRVADLLLSATHDILGKQPAVTAIALDYIAPEQWLIAGKSLAEHRLASFYFDVKITEGTNTKDEKARYIAAVFKGMQAVLGELHPESYIYVQEVRADAYGYAGLTQEYRYIAKQLDTNGA